jgi:hypothetical protein
MIRLPRISRHAGLAALVGLALAAAPSDAAAQRDRRATFLSDRPAPHRECRASPRPSRLPALDALADSAALHTGLADLARQSGVTQDTVFVLLSLWFDGQGAVERVEQLDYYAPQGMVGSVSGLVRGSLRKQPGAGYVRMRVHPGSGRVLVGRSEVCEPRGPDRVRVQRFQVNGRDSFQAFQARVIVTPEGRSLAVNKTRGSGDSSIDDFVVRMLTSARFTPGLVDGIPTQMEYEQTVRYEQ